VLDLEDKNNIDLKQFSRAGYIMPGTYSFTLKVNGEQLSEVSVPFYSPEDDPQASQACISTEIEEQLGLTSSAKKELTWWHDGECLALQSLPGMQVSGDLATSSLYVSIPQAYLEYTAPNWDPPSRWDEGITALMLDYNVNGNATKSYSSNSDSYALNGNGVVGVNLGAWRFRADWQGRLNHITGSGDAVNKDFDWNRFYA
ncbi:FimD/PapC N-terminal domain-containing protein, partial [Providencia rettgeri]